MRGARIDRVSVAYALGISALLFLIAWMMK